MSSQAPKGAFTSIVNPAKPVGLTQKSEKKMQLRKPNAPGGRRPAPRRRRNGLEGFVALVLPLVAGGGIAYLEAKNPEWWKKVDNKIRAVVFAAVAVVAQKRGMREAAGGAAVLCGIYAARAGIAYMATTGSLGSMLGAAGVTMEQVDAEMQLALDRARRAQVAGPVGALEHNAVGAFAGSGEEDLGGVTEVEEGIARAYGSAA